MPGEELNGGAGVDAEVVFEGVGDFLAQITEEFGGVAGAPPGQRGLDEDEVVGLDEAGGEGLGVGAFVDAADALGFGLGHAS